MLGQELYQYTLMPNHMLRPFTMDELKGADVGLVLYPLSAFRAMNKAAENVYGAIRRDGTQKNVVRALQTTEG